MDATSQSSFQNLKISPSVQSGFLESTKPFCTSLIINEIEAFFPLRKNVFTPREAAKAEKLGPRRRKAFTGARIALKIMALHLGLVEPGIPQCSIETLAPDGVRPHLPANDVYCSVSHDDIFVVAAANDRPIGVDIEPISSKASRGWHLFMSLPEQRLIVNPALGKDQTVVRAWTMKEAAAKALNFDLFRAWREVEVLRIGAEKSLLRIKGKDTSSNHLEIQGHLISLITFDDA
jgi:phosphopantetheinyl transferase